MERRATRTTRLSVSTDVISSESGKTRRAPSRTQKADSPPATRKSPARGKSPSRKSPARGKSPSRKSPVRGKSPSRRSPARKVKMSPIPEAAKMVRGSTIITKTEETKSYKSEKITESFNMPRTLTSPNVALRRISPHFVNLAARQAEIVEKLNSKLEDSGDAEVSKLTFNIDNLTPEPSQHSNLTPAISERSRRSASHSASRSLSRSVYEDEDSDQESILEQKREPSIKRSVPRQIPSLNEFGRLQALLLMVLTPIVCLYLTYSCNSKICTFKINFSRNEIISLLNPFISIKFYLFFVTFIWGIIILSLNPFGRFVKFFTADRGYTEFNCNAFSTALLSISIVYAIEYYLKYSLFRYILDHYAQFCLLSLIYGFVISVASYIRSIYFQNYNVQLNHYGKSGKILIDFFAGREINSKLFNVLDIKLIRYRIYLITVLLFNLIYLTRTIKLPSITAIIETPELSHIEKILLFFNAISYKESTLLISSLLIVYVLDQLVNEHNFVSSFEIQNEGVGGYLLMRYSALPFYLNSIGKYAYDYEINSVPRWVLALIGLTFILGIYLKRASDKLKYEFRLNPMNQKFLHVETIPTFQGKRLLCTGPWAFVRHPNYLGEIIALSTLLPILYWRFAWPPLISVLLIIISIIFRTVRIESRNSKKYMSSYQRYCSKVQFNLVPKIF